mmetsp:Transcript_13206/g.22403  ORF Transcript_13206/g.22403 Transcript_13206/m.22403 type:complete len:214 (+) Transcript_13206:352-993(+)
MNTVKGLSDKSAAFNECMKTAVNESGNFSNFDIMLTDLNGLLIIPFSEVLAIFPYLLRSLRMQKMFEAREIYYNEERIPRKMIQQWDEFRLLFKIFLPLVFLFGGACVISGLLIQYNVFVPNYNTLSYPLTTNGEFDLSMTKGYDLMNSFISTFSFLQYLLLLKALNEQWQIESEYSMFYEMLIVTVIWIFCNSLINFFWIFDYNFLTEGTDQ